MACLSLANICHSGETDEDFASEDVASEEVRPSGSARMPRTRGLLWDDDDDGGTHRRNDDSGRRGTHRPSNEGGLGEMLGDLFTGRVFSSSYDDEYDTSYRYQDAERIYDDDPDYGETHASNNVRRETPADREDTSGSGGGKKAKRSSLFDIFSFAATRPAAPRETDADFEAAPTDPYFGQPKSRWELSAFAGRSSHGSQSHSPAGWAKLKKGFSNPFGKDNFLKTAENGPECAPQLARAQWVGLMTWPSRAFRAAIINYDHMSEPSADECLRKCSPSLDDVADEIASYPMDSSQRQIALVKAYTMETPLYRKMNDALRNDDYFGMKALAGYIWELREVFCNDNIQQIVQPYSGTVYRGIRFPDPDSAVRSYVKDEPFAWEQFSSTSTNRNVTMCFGNVVFEIRCYPPQGAYEDDSGAEYCPAAVSQWSVFPSEDEVLFPPNVKFRVVNIEYPSENNDLQCYPGVHAVVQCETMAFDSIYGMIEHRDVEGVERWCAMNPDRVNTESCEYSIISYAAEREDLDDYEDEEEFRPRTRGLFNAAPQQHSQKRSVLSVLMNAGANPYEKDASGKTAVEKLEARRRRCC